jgi:hypothetical protein
MPPIFAAPAGAQVLEVCAIVTNGSVVHHSPYFTTFANLPVLALPMEHHGGEDQKDLSQPYMQY